MIAFSIISVLHSVCKLRGKAWEIPKNRSRQSPWNYVHVNSEQENLNFRFQPFSQVRDITLGWDLVVRICNKRYSKSIS